MTHLVVELDEVDDVGGVVGELAHHRAGDEGAQLLVQRHLVALHREDHVHVVLRHLVGDLTDGRVVLHKMAPCAKIRHLTGWLSAPNTVGK